MAYLETGNVEIWIRQQMYTSLSPLTLDAQLTALGVAGVHGYRIPQGSDGQHIVFSLVTGEDENAANGFRGASRMIYLIKAVCEGEDSAPAERIMDRVDALLQCQSGSVSGINVQSCVRQQIVKYPDIVNGKNYWHVGGNYRLWVEQA